MPESERLKVTALNLFHPTASPLFQNVGLFHIATQSQRGEGRVRGTHIKKINAFLLERSSLSPCFSPLNGGQNVGVEVFSSHD
jgi:hypothetical protein